MRDIRFRGQRKDNGEWVYGSYVWIGEHYYPPTKDCYIVAMDGKKWVIPETVGQAIGLKDKDGKEIYAASVMKCKVRKLIDKEELTGVIRWGKYKAGFALQTKDGRTLAAFRHPTGFGVADIKELPDGRIDGEVIGNIHDNPELLTEN